MLLLKEMTKIKKQGILTIPIIITIVAILAIVVAAAYKVRSGSIGSPTASPIESPNTQEFKIFQSKNLKFSIEVPVAFTIKETVAQVELNKGNLTISISKNSTNFLNIREYVNNFDLKRSGLVIQNESAEKINNLDSLNRIEKFSVGPIEQQKIYYIYIDSKVYSLSTSSPALYPDLDQIAWSFRYTP